MPHFDAYTAYMRFLFSLAGGLFGISLLMSYVIDQFFKDYSIRDYRRARILQKLESVRGDLDLDGVSVLDLASQLTSGRLSRRKEQELFKKLSSRSYRSLSSL